MTVSFVLFLITVPDAITVLIRYFDCVLTETLKYVYTV